MAPLRSLIDKSNRCPHCKGTGKIVRAPRSLTERGFKEAEWIRLLTHFGHCCAYCLDKPRQPLSADHVIPRVWLHANMHEVNNIVPACNDCNFLKGQMSARDFCNAMGYDFNLFDHRLKGAYPDFDKGWEMPIVTLDIWFKRMGANPHCWASEIKKQEMLHLVRE